MSAAVAGASAEDGDTNKDNDIKDYAETTMNELLGWYGYDKLDTRGVNLARPFPATSSSSSSPTRLEEDGSEEDTAAENECGGNSIVCGWCLKLGLKLFTLKTASGETKAFCSEPCFNQCRRAAFKKNRVCNWCRHVRHTVNYVDFQDGDDQLQFCSDKCLNQYKMQIFCKETQAYLQMNPHLQEETAKNTANSKLITPDLWLRDCQESTNGGDADKEELEDLSVAASKSEHGALSNQEIPKSVPIRDSPTERLASYLSDEKDRRKRHPETSKESSRKRQRMPSFRNKMSHPTEAPPAHLSSTHSSLSFPLFSPPAFPLPKSPVLINPPAAHSKTFTPHPNSILHPPPPPLLNNDYYHSSFNPPLFSSPQQQLDAVLRMQAGIGSNASFFPFLQQPNALPQPNTVMLPFPIFVPLPVPIPVPLPLRCFLPKDKETTNKNSKSSDEASAGKSQVSSTDNDDDENKSSKKTQKR